MYFYSGQWCVFAPALTESAGWSEDSTEYWYYGPLQLTNEDTGEEFRGEREKEKEMIYENYDHKFCEIFRLGENPQDPICGGDPDTWGEGFKTVGEVNIFSPTRGTEGKTYMHIGGGAIDLLDWEIEYAELTNFVRKISSDHFSDEEMDFVLWNITDTFFGEDYGIVSGHMAGEFPHSELSSSDKKFKGCLCVHKNVRYDSKSSVTNDGAVSWEDEVDPDDDEQRIAILI